MNILNSKGFIINPIHVYEQVDNLAPTEKPPPLDLSKTSLKPSTVSLECPKAPSKISSEIPIETPLTEQKIHIHHTYLVKLTSVENSI